MLSNAADDAGDCAVESTSSKSASSSDSVPDASSELLSVRLGFYHIMGAEYRSARYAPPSRITMALRLDLELEVEGQCASACASKPARRSPMRRLHRLGRARRVVLALLQYLGPRHTARRADPPRVGHGDE